MTKTKKVTTPLTLSAALAERGIVIEAAGFADAGKIFLSDNGSKYYCKAIYQKDGLRYSCLFMPKSGGRTPQYDDARVVAGRELLRRALIADYPCQRCGGSGIWQGAFKGVCFGCGGDGLHHKFFVRAWAMPTTY